MQALFGIKLPGVRTLFDLEAGFPDEFFSEVVYGETRRAIEAAGVDKVICWVSTGRTPHAGDPMPARDLLGILRASEAAGLQALCLSSRGYGRVRVAGFDGNLWDAVGRGSEWVLAFGYREARCF